MSRLSGRRHLFGTLLLPLLAASLACSALTGGGASAGAALTQAAATITTASNQAATALAAAPTSPPIPTQAPTAVPPTVADTPTATEAAAATATATAAATLAPAGTATPAANGTTEATPGGAVVLDPCTLLTVDQAQSLTGVAMGSPKAQSGGCLIADAATSQTTGVILYALPASQAGTFFSQWVPSLKQSGVTVDPKAAAKLDQDSAAGDMVAAVNDVIAMAINQPKFKAQKVDGLGSAALWTWNTVLGSQQGLILTARPGAVVALALIASASTKEADAQAAMQQIASGILANLPDNFTVAGLQVAGSAPALDPCSLANVTDIDHVMGTQSEDGVAANGMCNFTDVATHKLQVRVFALPAGTAAQNALTLASLTMLVGNAAGEAKVTADLAKGDLVAAVTDLGAAVTTSSRYFLETTNGLGDAGFLSIQTVGSERVAYFIVAKADALVGVEGLLGPGDDKATSAVGRSILEQILATLPDKFTVNGVP